MTYLNYEGQSPLTLYGLIERISFFAFIFESYY